MRLDLMPEYPIPFKMSGRKVVNAYTGIVAHMFCEYIISDHVPTQDNSANTYKDDHQDLTPVRDSVLDVSRSDPPLLAHIFGVGTLVSRQICLRGVAHT
jgi:hypothetical protein